MTARSTPAISAADLLERTRRTSRWNARREPESVLIAADGPLSGVLSVAFGGLGARRIRIHSSDEPTPDERPLRSVREDDRRGPVRVLRHAPVRSRTALETIIALREVRLVVATDRHPEALAAARRLGIPAYRIAVSGSVGRWDLGPCEPGIASGPATLEAQLFAAGTLAADFVERFVIGEGDEPLPPGVLTFDLSNPFGGDASGTIPDGRFTRPLRILIVGAGGLGCPVAYALGQRLAAGSRVYICDDDYVEASNLNRQFLFGAEDVGVSKARALCAVMSSSAALAEWIPVTERCPNPLIAREAPFDLVFTLTDTHSSRLAIAQANLAETLVNASVDTRSATTAIYHPGTPSIVDATCIVELAERETTRARCQDALPSIITTNLIGGALAVARAVRHIHLGPGPAKSFHYESCSPMRGGALSFARPVR